MARHSLTARLFSAYVILSAVLGLSGCVTYGDIDNLPQSDEPLSSSYSISNSQTHLPVSDTAVLLAFSGGGTRAAALAYGVLKKLRETPVPSQDDEHRLLEDVRGISAVSGGSFTAAYYGLNGDDTFRNFESDFLRRDVATPLLRNLWNPLHWFSHRGRTDYAVDFYNKTVFKGATFADLQLQNGPMILLNASDLGHGVHFSFVQEYFDLLCSDLSSFPIARAVAASSAVPFVFHPVVLKRYGNCSQLPVTLATSLAERAKGDAELALLLDGLGSYEGHENESFIHLVDGGITDNLGLRAVYEMFAVAGGARKFFLKLHRDPPKRIVVISVNASIRQTFPMNGSNRRPSVTETMLAMSDLQLRRYNATTLNLIKSSLTRWTEELSSDDHPVKSWFIDLDFNDVEAAEEREKLNAIPTTMTLNDDQIDRLIRVGQELLTSDENFQRVLQDMGR